MLFAMCLHPASQSDLSSASARRSLSSPYSEQQILTVWMQRIQSHRNKYDISRASDSCVLREWRLSDERCHWQVKCVRGLAHAVDCISDERKQASYWV